MKRMLVWAPALLIPFFALAVFSDAFTSTFNPTNVTAVTVTVANGSNGSQPVGYVVDGNGTYRFVETTSAFTQGVTVPSNGTNSAGQSGGDFKGAAVIPGFVDTGGAFMPIVTVANGINTAGQSVGYVDDGSETHGFFATLEPKPSPDQLPTYSVPVVLPSD